MLACSKAKLEGETTMRSVVGKLLVLALATLALGACRPQPSTQAGDAAFGGSARLDKALAGKIYYLPSDDGSRLFIDHKLVVDDDGVHSESSVAGAADLSAGRHMIEVQYFQGPATEVALQLWCTRPGGGEAVFPGCGLNLTRPQMASTWLVWLAAIVIIAVLLLILRRSRPKPPQEEPPATP
jgi:hypothetical protein